MRRSFVGAALAVAAVLVLAAPAAAGTTYGTHLTGASEVPSRETPAVGQAIFRYSGVSLDYRLIASNIDNVVASHIHAGPAGTNGPVVAFLFGAVSPGGGRHDGVLATGSITDADLTGPLAGGSLGDLIALLDSGDAYVNVHTNDGVGATNTGPGDFPGGEIRGQIAARG